jgi:hypothetical protein
VANSAVGEIARGLIQFFNERRSYIGAISGATRPPDAASPRDISA